MKVWKHILFVAGVTAILGFFLPLIEVQHKAVAVSFSARQLSFGLEKTHKILDKQLPKLAEKYIPAEYREDRDDARIVAEASRGAALIYIPAVLMVVAAVFGLVKQRFGRALGATALMLGLVSIAAWIGLRHGIDYGLTEADLPHVSVTMRFGAHIVLVAGIVAAIVGIGALVKPEHRAPPARAS